MRPADHLAQDNFVRDHVNQTGPTRLTETIAAFIIFAIISYSALIKQNKSANILIAWNLCWS